MRKLGPLTCAVAMLSAVCLQVFGAENMNIEDFLLFPYANVATQTEEKVVDAPGIIKVFLASDIRSLNYYTLRELADITPGYASVQKQLKSGFVVRGLDASTTQWNNDRVLLLVDGIPVSAARSFTAPIDEELPVHFAKSVEFLKGPSSALYGRSAFYGVVNVRPDNIKDIKESSGAKAELIITGGTPDSVKRYLSSIGAKSENLAINIYSSYYGKTDRTQTFQTDAYALGYRSDPYYARIRDRNDSTFLMSSIDVIGQNIFNGLTLGTIYTDRYTGGYQQGASSPYGANHVADDIQFKSVIPYAKYKKELLDNLTLNSRLSYNSSTELGTMIANRPEGDPRPYTSGTIFAVYDIRTYVVDADVNANYLFDETTNFIGGIAWNRMWNGGNPEHFTRARNTGLQSFPTDPSEKYEVGSGYVQGKKEIAVLKGLDITVGLRTDASQEFVKTSYNPRVGIVQRITDHINAKALYGTAIKGPDARTLNGVRTEQQTGTRTEGILPEKVKTYEASVVYYNTLCIASVTYFNERVNDLIAGTVNQNSQLKTTGVELDTEYKIGKGKVFVNGAVSYPKDDKIEQGSQTIGNAPKISASAGTIMDIVGFDMGLIARYAQYTDNKIDHSSVSFPYRAARTDPHVIFDVNVMKTIVQNIQLGLQIKNVMDKEYELPNRNDAVISDYIQPGRQIFASADFKF